MPAVMQQMLLANGVIPATLDFQGAASYPSEGQTVTFTAVAIGAPAGDRRVFVAIPYYLTGSDNIAIATVTIGGVLATIHAQVFQPAEVSVGGTALVSALVPTGTTADIVITWAASGVSYRPYIAVYRVTGLQSAAPVDIKALAPPNTNTVTSVAINVVNDGIAIVCFNTYYSGVNSRTLTGLPTDYQNNPFPGKVYIGGGDETTADGTKTAGVDGIAVLSVIMASFR